MHWVVDVFGGEIFSFSVLSFSLIVLFFTQAFGVHRS